MADNSTLPVSTGTEVFANKDIGPGVKFPKHIQYDSTGTEVVPATQTTAAAILAKLSADPATQTTLAAVLAKLSSDPATQTTLSAANTNLASILTALNAQRAETIWTDDTGTYVVRVDKGGTITWVALDGTAGTAPGTGARPVDADTFSLSRASYQASTAATGYSVGDLIDHMILVNPTTGTVVSHFWINLTTELKLASAPTSANIVPFSAEEAIMGLRIDAANTATDATSVSGMSVWKQISKSVQALMTFFGAQADAANAATNTTAISPMAVWKQISASVQALATAIGSTAWDLGPGTAGTRTQRVIMDSSQVSGLLDCSASITRPADTAIYANSDNFANSTTVPTAGGFTFTGAASASGGGGIITDAVIVASGGTLYQGEIWVFDSAVTAVNDNAAFALSDSDALKLLGKIPFTLAVEDVNNASAHITGLNMSFHCIGTADLRFMVRLFGTPTPASAESLNVRIKGIRS